MAKKKEKKKAKGGRMKGVSGNRISIIHTKWKFQISDRVFVKKSLQRGTVAVLSSSNPKVEMRYYIKLDEGGQEWYSGGDLAKLKKKGKENGAS